MALNLISSSVYPAVAMDHSSICFYEACECSAGCIMQY